MNSPIARQRAIQLAHQILAQKPLYLDTETTGLERSDEIVEISILDEDGKELFNSLVRPSQLIPGDVIAIHGINNDMVKTAPLWPIVWPKVKNFLSGRLIIIYNEDFDIRMMQQSHLRYRMPWKEQLTTKDLMKIYAEFRGEWDSRRGSYRWHSLENARKQCNILLPNSHRSSDDALLTRALLHFIAQSDK